MTAGTGGTAAERDLSNAQLVGTQGGEIVIALPKNRMTRQEALVHAAWLVLVADQFDEFAMVLDAVSGAE